MILGLEKKYSKMANIQPTKGVTRSSTTVMGMSISVWDLGGQQSYRTQYIKDAELYLYDCDLIFYLVDAREIERLEESIDYYSRILKALSDFEENPSVIICLHKIDPDAPESIKENIKKAMERFKEATTSISSKFSMKFFETTIFEPYTLISAFSYGLATLNPNRDIFKLQLENLAKTVGARAVILLNDKGIVLSDYTVSDKEAYLFELGAHHFTSLHGNLSQVLNSNKEPFKERALYILGDNYFSFHALKVDESMTLNVLIFVQGKDASEKVAATLDSFKTNIKSLIDTYF
nr:ADP-ribosylation factor-like protein [Candidatus Sigynarchaeota archaeon]